MSRWGKYTEEELEQLRLHKIENDRKAAEIIERDGRWKLHPRIAALKNRKD